MKKFFLIGWMLLLMGSVVAQQIPLIPAPLEAVKLNGVFKLSKNTPLVVEGSELNGVAQYLQQELLRLKTLPLFVKHHQGGLYSNAIQLKLIKGTADESYELTIQKEGITIIGTTAAGVFNGASSLVQLINNEKMKAGQLILPTWKIKDKPRYEWRGLMLDESRYFIGKEKLLSIIDWMAFYKLNRFHWHLTDEPAWRIEIKKYPKLALVGGIGDYNDPTKPSAYYTQREISEVVDYAAKRNITIIPEIDMPGHTTAANRAYPEYSGGGNEQHPDFTFDPGNPDTYTYLSNILREVNAIFPSGMLHLGGDEVSFGSDKWLQNSGIKEIMTEHQLKDLKGVESYFMNRMADSVSEMGAKIAGWDEIVDFNLPKENTIVYWWRHDKPEQLQKSLKKGYKTIVSPRLPYYLDFVQDSSHRAGRKWGKLYNTLKDVYSFSIDDWVSNKEDQKQVLGIQGNLWSETITNTNRLDYFLFPRMAALAESAWSANEVKNYQQFEERMKKHLEFYRDQNIYFYNPFDPKEIPEPVFFKHVRKDLTLEQN